MLKIFSNIKNIPLIWSGSKVLFWQALTLTISFFVSIISTRLLGPSNLGVVGMIQSGYQQMLLLISLTPNNYLVRIVKYGLIDENLFLQKIISFRFILSVFLSFLFFIISLFFFLNTIWFNPILLGLMIFIVNSLNVTWLLQAYEKQFEQYKINFLVALSNLLFMTLFFIFQANAILYMVILLLTSILGSYFSLRYSQIRIDFKTLMILDLQFLKKHINKGIYIYITDILIYIYAGFQLSLVGYLLTIKEAGLFRSANSLVGAVHSVFIIIPVLLYPRFIEWMKKGIEYLWIRQIKLLFYLTFFSIIVFVISYFYSSLIFQILFGSEFEDASYTFVVLLASKLLVLLNGLFAYGLLSQEKDKKMLFIFITTSIISLFLNLYLLPIYGIIAAAYISVLSEFLIFVFTFYSSYKIVKLKRRSNNEKI